MQLSEWNVVEMMHVTSRAITLKNTMCDSPPPFSFLTGSMEEIW